MKTFVSAAGLALALVCPVTAQDPRSALMLGTLEGMDRRFEQMSVQQQQAAAHLAAIGQEIKAMRSDLGRYQSRMDEFDRRLSEMESRLAAPVIPAPSYTPSYNPPRPTYEAPRQAYSPPPPAFTPPAYSPPPPVLNPMLVSYPRVNDRPPMVIPASSPTFSPTGNYDAVLQPGTYVLIRVYEVR